MGLLNRLFGSTESIAIEIKEGEEFIIKHWKDYLATIPKKKKIINKLSLGDKFQSNLQELEKLLKLELVDISDEEKEELELISDLDAMGHSEKIERVHTLARCLGYAATKYKYAHKLLDTLHSILKSQMHLVEKLQKESKKNEELISHFKSQFELEFEIQNKIKKLETFRSWRFSDSVKEKTREIFHNLFLAVVTGEKIISPMNSEEEKLLEKMQETFNKVASGEIKSGILHKWAVTVLVGIEDKVHEAVVTGMFRGYQPDSDFEYVNRPEFIDLVKESMPQQELVRNSKQRINVFVHLFREWYNHVPSFRELYTPKTII